MKGNQPVITICGFYGSGNSGDEAMLRTFVYQIRKRIPNCVFYVAANKFGSWKTNDLYYISGVDRTKLKISDMFILGGGDLSVGFGWNLLPFAKVCDCKIVMASVSINKTWLKKSINDCVFYNLQLFDKIFVRDMDSYENLKKLGVKSKATTDVAIELLINDNLDFYKKNKHVTLCVREVAGHDNKDMINDATYVINYMLDCGFSISLLPLCPADRIIAEQLTENNFEDVQIVYSTEPEHHKYIISKSNYLVSLGRLHPLIYATGIPTPMIGMTYPSVEEYHKIRAWMKYVNMEKYCIEHEDVIKDFSNKWHKLRSNQSKILLDLETQRRKLFDLNQKQFDEIAGLIT